VWAHVLEVGDSGVVVTDGVGAPVPVLAGVPVTITQRVAIPREWT
jgi:hypothetical protein